MHTTLSGYQMQKCGKEGHAEVLLIYSKRHAFIMCVGHLSKHMFELVGPRPSMYTLSPGLAIWCASNPETTSSSSRTVGLFRVSTACTQLQHSMLKMHQKQIAFLLSPLHNQYVFFIFLQLWGSAQQTHYYNKFSNGNSVQDWPTWWADSLVPQQSHAVNER